MLVLLVLVSVGFSCAKIEIVSGEWYTSRVGSPECIVLISVAIDYVALTFSSRFESRLDSESGMFGRVGNVTG